MKQQPEIMFQFVWGLAIVWNTATLLQNLFSEHLAQTDIQECQDDDMMLNAKLYYYYYSEL